MTAKERVARHLRKHGQVSEADFDGTNNGYVADGGKPIHRVPARVRELRADGWRSRTDMVGGRALYVLISEPGMPAVAEPKGMSNAERFERDIPPVDDVIASWAEEAA